MYWIILIFIGFAINFLNYQNQFQCISLVISFDSRGNRWIPLVSSITSKFSEDYSDYWDLEIIFYYCMKYSPHQSMPQIKLLIIMISLLYILYTNFLFSGLFLRKLKFWALCEIGFIFTRYELKLNSPDILPLMHSFYELCVKNANCTGAFLSGSLPCHKAFMLLVHVLHNKPISYCYCGLVFIPDAQFRHHMQSYWK
jgi:hypothetical protein